MHFFYNFCFSSGTRAWHHPILYVVVRASDGYVFISICSAEIKMRFKTLVYWLRSFNVYQVSLCATSFFYGVFSYLLTSVVADLLIRWVWAFLLNTLRVFRHYNRLMPYETPHGCQVVISSRLHKSQNRTSTVPRSTCVQERAWVLRSCVPWTSF